MSRADQLPVRRWYGVVRIWVLAMLAPWLVPPQSAAQTSEARWVPLEGEVFCRSTSAKVIRACVLDAGALEHTDDVQVFLPLRPGVALRVSADAPIEAAMGFGSRVDSLSVVQRPGARTHEFYAPTFGGADFAIVALRPGVSHRMMQVVSPGTHVATRAAEQAAFEALRENRARDPQEDPKSVAVSRAEARMHELRGLLPQVSASLWAQWLADEIDRLERQFEPLRTPWFVGLERHEVQALDEGETRFSSDDADVWSLGLRGALGRMNVIEVWVGDNLRRVERMDLRARPRPAAPRFGPQRRVRIPIVRGAGEGAPDLLLRVRAGGVHAQAVAYRERPSAFGPHAPKTPRLSTTIDSEETLLAGAIALGRASTGREAGARFLRAALAAVNGPWGNEGRRAFVHFLHTRHGALDEVVAAHVASAAKTELLGPSVWAEMLALMQRRQVFAPPALCDRRDAIVSSGGAPSTRPVDRIVVRASLTQMCDEQARALDAVGLLESAIRRYPDDLFLRAVARAGRRTHLRWETLDAVGAARVPWVRPVPVREDEAQCRAKGFAGVRWSVLSPGHHQVRVEDEDVRVRTLHADDAWEGRIRILDTPVSVHGALGLESRVRVPLGDVAIDVPADAPPLLVRLARTDEVSCSALRDVAFPLQAGQATTFTLRPEDSWLGFARLDVLPVAASEWSSSQQGWGAPADRLRFRIVTGGESFIVTLPSGQRTSLTIPVARGTQLVTVLPAPESVGQSLVQLRVPRGRGVSVSHRLERLVRAETEASQQTALAELREASSMLVMSGATLDPRTRSDLHLRRARALFSLGYTTLALAERDLAGATDLRFGTAQAQVTFENMAAELPPLPVRDLSKLRLTRELLGRGAVAHARRILSLSPPASAESAMLAMASEKDGDLRAAASAWLTTETAVGHAQAAALYAQLAEHGGDTRQVVLAFAHASAAEKGRVANNSVHGRLQRAVQWERPAAAQEAAGTELVVSPRAPSDALMYEVRRAYMNAPPDAYVLDEGQQMQLTLAAGQQTRLSLESGCVSVLPHVPCRLWLEVNDGPARPLEVLDALVLEKGRHQIVVRGEGRAYSWVRVRGEDGARMFEPEIARLWFAAEQATPMRFAAMTPTVGRFRLSTQGRESVEVDVLRDDQKVASLTVPASEMADVTVPLLGEGPARIEVRPRSGRVLVRPSVVTHAEPLEVAQTPAMDVPAPARPLARTDATDRPDFADDAILGPVALRLSTRAVWGQTSDFDAVAEGTPFLEAVLDADHRDLAGAWSVHGQVFGRARLGPPSFGLSAAAQFEGDGLRPRVSVSTAVAAQHHDRLYLGNQNRASLVWGVPVHRQLSLHPVIAGGFRYAPEVPADAQSVDAEVSSSFARAHPYSGTVGLVLYSRPLLELFARGGVYATTNADFASVDRVSARTSITGVWGGTYFPFAELEYEASQRFADQDRARDILRQVATLRMDGFATWFDTDRLSAGVELQWVFDRSEFLGFVSLEYLWSAGRGLYDQDSRRAPYPELLEEPGVTSLRVRGNHDELEADTSFDRTVSP